MPTTDPRVDAYIERSKDFARPVLGQLRQLVHEACPEVVETIKWSFPNFDYKGPLCHMASFKAHCAFGFWKQSLLEGSAFPAEKTAMGSFGRITSLDDLPDDATIKKLIVEAVRLNEEGIKVPKAPSTGKKELIVPDILTSALATPTNSQPKHLTDFHTLRKRITSSGSPRQKPKPPATNVSAPRSNG